MQTYVDDGKEECSDIPGSRKVIIWKLLSRPVMLQIRRNSKCSKYKAVDSGLIFNSLYVEIVCTDAFINMETNVISVMRVKVPRVASGLICIDRGLD